MYGLAYIIIDYVFKNSVLNVKFEKRFLFSERGREEAKKVPAEAKVLIESIAELVTA